MDFFSKAQQIFFSSSDKTDVTKMPSRGLRRRRASSFRSKYSLGGVLGKGTYSVVRKGYDLGTKERVAVKCIDELALSDKDAKALQREVKILSNLRHKHIISFKDFFYDSREKMFFIVTEYCGGGEMFDAVVAKTCYSEQKVRSIMFALADAVKHLHDRNITHRDLKPENILLKVSHSKGDFSVSSLKIADFGFAYQHKNASDNNFLKTVCGSPIYVAPEILRHHSSSSSSKGYLSKQVDVWSLGIIMYVLLCGYPPFMVSENKSGSENEKLFEKIKSGKFKFDEKYWKNISVSAKELVTRMLTVDPRKRATVGEVLKHPWFDFEKKRLKNAISPKLNIHRTRLVEANGYNNGHRWSNLKTAVNKLRFLSASTATIVTTG